MSASLSIKSSDMSEGEGEEEGSSVEQLCAGVVAFSMWFNKEQKKYPGAGGQVLTMRDLLTWTAFVDTVVGPSAYKLSHL